MDEEGKGGSKMLTDRIKKLIHDSSLSLPKFAEMVDVSKNTLVNYRDGTTLPAADFLETICKQFGVNPLWLLLGEGDPYSSGKPAPSEPEPIGKHFREDYEFIPLLKSQVTGGPDGEILYPDIDDHYPFKRWWLEKLVGRTPERIKDLVLIRVRGDSMAPTINQGEIAMVDLHETERMAVLPGRIYMVILPDGSIALKRLVLSRDADIFKLACLSDNTADYRPFEFTLDAGKSLRNYILGRVRWVGKEFD